MLDFGKSGQTPSVKCSTRRETPEQSPQRYCVEEHSRAFGRWSDFPQPACSSIIVSAMGSGWYSQVPAQGGPVRGCRETRRSVSPSLCSARVSVYVCAWVLWGVLACVPASHPIVSDRVCIDTPGGSDLELTMRRNAWTQPPGGVSIRRAIENNGSHRRVAAEASSMGRSERPG